MTAFAGTRKVGVQLEPIHFVLEPAGDYDER